MAPYHQGQNVRGGFYLNRSKWEFEHVAGKDGVLPGEDEMLYSRVPLLFIVIVGPLIGLACAGSPPRLCSTMLSRWEVGLVLMTILEVSK